jgi:hypothetical protein
VLHRFLKARCVKISGTFAFSLLGSCLELLLDSDHLVNASVHFLDERAFALAEAVAIGDVVGAVRGFGVLAVDASDLDIVLLRNTFEALLVLGKQGQGHVN